uniref:Uncharacterized protein n=1 Tax=Rhizophora mucronata TaxID=61149 RepID=A0A2P2J071_RHIMU
MLHTLICLFHSYGHSLLKRFFIFLEKIFCWQMGDILSFVG